MVDEMLPQMNIDPPGQAKERGGSVLDYRQSLPSVRNRYPQFQ
jgi:hypothetical protein